MVVVSVPVELGSVLTKIATVRRTALNVIYVYRLDRLVLRYAV